MEIKDSKSTQSEIVTITEKSDGFVKPFGGLFTEARKQKKISIEQAVEELFIKKHQLRALEDERFEDLPYYAFARSFALKYAEYLELTNIDIADKFDATYPSELKVARDTPYDALNNEIARDDDREDEKSLHFNPALLLSFFAVLALAVFLSKKVSSAEEEHNKPLPIDEGISKIEQRQGAMLENSDQ